MDNVKQDLINNLNNVNTIVVACSGGPDSMCLLHLLLDYQKNHSLNIICAHVNHNIRKESQNELEFVKKFCQNNNLIFESTTLNETNHSEENLRIKRHKFLKTIVIKYQASYLLTAHHGDDLIETILMRLTRGSNLKGYIGFEKISYLKECPIYRPLISVTKEEIIKYNKLNNVQFVIDSSNNSDDYTRNRYRHNILPFLKKENTNVHTHFYDFSKEMSQCFNLVSDITNSFYNKNYHDNSLNIKHLSKENPLIQKSILQRYLNLLYPDNLNLLTKKHLNLLYDLALSKGNSQIYLPNNIIILKEYDLLKTQNLSPAKDYSIVFSTKQNLPNGYILEIVSQTEEKSNYILRLNSQEIKLPLLIRNKKPQDKIEIKNLNGSKKIQDIFTNEKISKELRASYPILTDSNGTILWIPGLKKSKFDKDKNEKYDIIIRYYSN